MSTRNISWGVNSASARGWQPYHLHVQIVLKSGSLNLLESPGPVQALQRLMYLYFYTNIHTVKPRFYIPTFVFLQFNSQFWPNAHKSIFFPDLTPVLSGVHKKIKLRFYYTYIYICISCVSETKYHGSANSGVCVVLFNWRGLVFKHRVCRKRGKAGCTVYVLIRVPRCIQRWLNSVMIRHSTDFNKTEATTNVHNSSSFIITKSGFGGLVVSMLASGTRVHGFKPGRSRRIFSGVKILSIPSFGREVKPWVPCRRFVAR
jgi:hypothetical protein